MKFEAYGKGNANQLNKGETIQQNDLLEKQQQQHQVLPPGSHSKDKVGGYHNMDDSNVNKDQDVNAAIEDDHHEVNHQIAPPGDKNAAHEEDKDNHEVNHQIAPPGEKDLNAAMEVDKVDHHDVNHQIAPPGGVKRDNSNVAREIESKDEHQQNIPPPGPDIKIGNENPQQNIPVPDAMVGEKLT